MVLETVTNTFDPNGLITTKVVEDSTTRSTSSYERDETTNLVDEVDITVEDIGGLF